MSDCRNLEARVQKTRNYCRAVTSAYLSADRKLALLKPMIECATLADRYTRRYAAHGYNDLRFALYFDVVRDAHAFTFDTNKNSASMKNVLRLVKQSDLREELRRDYCTEPNHDSLKELPEDIRRPIEKRFRDEYAAQNGSHFDALLSTADREFMCLWQSSLGHRIRLARNKLVGHYAMVLSGDEPRLYTPEDIGMTWGDISDFLGKVQPLVQHLELIVSGTDYAFENFRSWHKVTNYYPGITSVASAPTPKLFLEPATKLSS